MEDALNEQKWLLAVSLLSKLPQTSSQEKEKPVEKSKAKGKSRSAQKLDSQGKNKDDDKPEMVFLNAKFTEKEECKALGGLWNPDVKKW
jgi:hypothetical protein